MSDNSPEIKELKKTIRKQREALEKLTTSNIQFINWIDAEMKRPSDVERGKRVAQATNSLELVNDGVMHFTLDYSFKKINLLKGKK